LSAAAAAAILGKRIHCLKTRGIFLLYRALQAFGLPCLFLYCLYRGLRNRAYFQNLRQLFGFLPQSYKQTISGAIWLHAVSVGEIIAAIALVRRLREELPLVPVFVSTATIAGRATAEEKLDSLAAGIFYAPFDYVFAVRRVLRTLRPSLVIVLETEIWPNLFHEAKRSGASLLLANGRISDRALPRYQKLRPFFQHVLCFPDAILVQSEPMRQRFLETGAPPEIVRAAGNLKFDLAPQEAPPDSPVRAFVERTRPSKIWIAASTMPPRDPGDVDEDDAVIEAFRNISANRPGLLLILAPRRPERFDAAARKLEQAGIRFIRRTALRDIALPGVLLLDTIGELAGLFPLADAVFLGGTLAARGGHNPLEPAFFARPLVVGPHMENFREIADDFRAARAWVEIETASSLAPAIAKLLDDPDAALGQRALTCAQARGGALGIVLAEARRLHDQALYRHRPWLGAWLLLWPLSRLWRWGALRKRERDFKIRKQLAAPVISVGNLTTGGAGKTPFTLYLAERLKASGRKVGILTRGYGRQSPHKLVIARPGDRIPVAHTGDEPQILIRSGIAPVGIGPDRYSTGRLLEREFHLDTLLLDDGFQHFRLSRKVDIVLFDGLDAFGNGELVPLGRLREPLEAVERAHMIVITRPDHARSLPAIERRLREFNPSAPVFYARTEAECWVEQATGKRISPRELPTQRVAAFCGLGNPNSFWSSLHALGIDPIDKVEFRDHHQYRPHEIRRMRDLFLSMAAGAVVTTEKDLINLCHECEHLFAPLPLYWLKIRLAVDDEEALLQEIERLAFGKR
jgi:3-deoxy-D-manno-octulosonic-acid transferase